MAMTRTGMIRTVLIRLLPSTKAGSAQRLGWSGQLTHLLTQEVIVSQCARLRDRTRCGIWIGNSDLNANSLEECCVLNWLRN